jgi:hypothetical protein
MMILSIPGSGTRALIRHLKLPRDHEVTHILLTDDKSETVEKYRHVPDVSVPFRDPLAVMLTCEAFPNRVMPNRLDWEVIVEICKMDTATVYKTDDLPEVVGQNRPNYPRKALYKERMWDRLQDLIYVVNFPGLVGFTNDLGIETPWANHG